MEVSTDYFDRLPDEVIQIIFSAISDCKSLVRCMCVSKAFRRQSVLVSSLSIVCPGNFSSYDERLQKIFSMVKCFRNLQSLVVRVGQPKEEPPSWARCMRYAEIGGSVEKFVFMAAKSGDFSELDFALSGLDNVTDDDTFLTGSNLVDEGGRRGRRPIEEVDTDGRSSFMETLRKGNGNGSTEAWSCFESDKETVQRVKAEGVEEDGSQDGKSARTSKYKKFLQSNAYFLRGPGQRRHLSDFSLRQVIAPSKEVLNRMLPVIHFAIVQGLNELRDSIPAFVSEFPELRRFLLVDMVESITVFMREHHIQEIRALHLETLNECDRESLEALPNVDPSRSGTGQDGREVQSHVERNGHCARDTDVVKIINARNMEMQSCSVPNEIGAEKHSSLVLKEDCHTSHIQAEENSEAISMQAASERDDHSWKLRSIIKDTERKGKELPNNYLGHGSCESSCEKYMEQYQGMQNTAGIPSSWSDPPECSLQMNTATVKGKGILLDQRNFRSQVQVSNTGDEVSCTGLTAPHDWIALRESDNIGLEDLSSSNSRSKCPARNSTANLYGDRVPGQDRNHMNDLPSSGDSEDGSTDVEEYLLSSFNGRHKGVATAGSYHGSSPPFGKLVKGRWDAACYSHDLEVPAYGSEEAGKLNIVSAERDNDQLLQLRYVEGWDGRPDLSDGDHLREREELHRSKSCKLSREGKVDMASRHPFKRCPKFDSCRMKDRNIRAAGHRRRDDNLANFDSCLREDTRAHRCLRFMGRVERVEVAVKENARDSKDVVATKVHLGVRTRDEKDHGVFCIQDLSISHAEASSSWSDHCLPGTSSDTSFSDTGRDSWKQTRVLEQSLSKESATAVTCEVGRSLLYVSDEEKGIPPISCNSGKQCLEVSLQGTILNEAQKEAEVVETDDEDKFVTESTKYLELQYEGMANERCRGESRHINSESPRFLLERPAEAEDWRYVWRDRMRRLRDNLREAPDQGEQDGNQEERRERAQELLRKQQRQLEKDALSFDYTFWKAEHVAAYNYVLSDVSMCIVTHAPRPLKDTDKESLKHAALAGPLLLATFSHVNKHHTGHNL